MTDPNPIINLDDVRFSWPGTESFSLHIDKLKVQPGEAVLVLGPSGCGKSSLLSLLCGVAEPRNGLIEVLGQDLSNLTGRRRERFRAEHFGVIFQMFNLLPYATVMDNVLLPLHFAPDRKRAVELVEPARKTAAGLLDHLGLPSPLHNRPARALSVGQQQRVAAARALIGAPEIILADEATSALDKENEAAFLELLFGQARQAGSTILFVSHDENLAPWFDRSVRFPALGSVTEATA